MALFHVGGDGVGGLGTEPGGGTDLRLPAEAVGVLETEASEDGVDGGGDFGRVGVAWAAHVSADELMLAEEIGRRGEGNGKAHTPIHHAHG